MARVLIFGFLGADGALPSYGFLAVNDALSGYGFLSMTGKNKTPPSTGGDAWRRIGQAAALAFAALALAAA